MTTESTVNYQALRQSDNLEDRVVGWRESVDWWTRLVALGTDNIKIQAMRVEGLRNATESYDAACAAVREYGNDGHH